MSTLELFDDNLADLAPLTDLRDTADIRTGVLTTRERWTVIVAQARNLPELPAGFHLHINARCPLPPSELESLQPHQALVDEASGHTVAAIVADGEDHDAAKETKSSRGSLIARPYHVRDHRDACIAFDLERLARPTGVAIDVNTVGAHHLHVEPDAKIYPGVTFDLENGHVLIAKDATVRPNAVIVGPSAIGRGSTVNENAIIKANTVIGPQCKVGGEVGGTIFQGHANKAHEGHLGDSWIGEWANLGAATTNSNLLNTYAQVAMTVDPSRGPEQTGQTFMGAIVADHVKTAIGTRIMTGAVMMTGTMYAATAPVVGHIPRFSWITDAGTHPYKLDKFIEVMRTVMARRHIEPTQDYLDTLTALHAATHDNA